jgi:hypothetical protein
VVVDRVRRPRRLIPALLLRPPLPLPPWQQSRLLRLRRPSLHRPRRLQLLLRPPSLPLRLPPQRLPSPPPRRTRRARPRRLPRPRRRSKQADLTRSSRLVRPRPAIAGRKVACTMDQVGVRVERREPHRGHFVCTHAVRTPRVHTRRRARAPQS